MGKPESAERKPATATIKIDAELLHLAKQTAAIEGVKLTDYFDRIIRGPVKREHDRAMQRAFERHQQKDGTK